MFQRTVFLCCITRIYCEGELVEYAASLGSPVDVWTINPADDFERFIGMGAASITTPSVRELRYHLQDVVESGVRRRV